MDKTTVKRLLAATLVLVLAGCSVSVARPAKQIVRHRLSPKTVSVARPTTQFVPHKPSVIAEAPKSTNVSEGTPLMKCMSEACRAMCSPNVAKESRPKWCAYFTEPI
jgi:hypothetical protein